MVDHLNVSYLYKKCGVYYFSKRVPNDLKSHYKTNRIVICLRTKSNISAIRSKKSILQKLDDYWTSVRITQMKIPAIHLVNDNDREIKSSNLPLLSEALGIYLKLKGIDKGKTFIRGAKRNIQYVIDFIGDLSIDNYQTKDASAFRDYLLDKGLLISTVKRIFSSIRSIVNLCIREGGYNCINAFSKTYMPDIGGSKIRKSINSNNLKTVQSYCRQVDDEPRWLISLLSDSGMRLSEALGLAKEDIKLDEPIPYIRLIPHPWRRLKTRSSQRYIPLVGEALWACKRILEHNDDSIFAFPRYTSINQCNANSASAALNKWLKSKLIDDYVIHGFRHSFRDRLRAVECPSEIIDQLGGWSLKSVGQGYGRGYDLKHLSIWMSKISL